MTPARWLLVFAGFCIAGCACVLAGRGDWAVAWWMGAVVLVPVILWLCVDLAVTAVAAREHPQRQPEPEPPPVPRLESFPAPRTERESRPPWDTATMPVVPAQPDADDLDVAGRHRKHRELKDALADAVRKAARVPLP